MKNKGRAWILLLCGMLLSAAIGASSAEAGRIAYVADLDSDVVSRLDTSTDAFLSASFSGMDNTQMLQVSPDGKNLWIPLYDSNQVSVVDLAADRQPTSIDVNGHPVGVVFSPDSTKAYVSSYAESTIQVFDTATRQQIGDDIPVPSGPYYESLSPDGTRLYVAGLVDHTVTVIDTANRQPLGDPTPVCGSFDSMTISPDGAKLFIGCGEGDDEVTELSTETMQPTSFSATLPDDPEYLTISPDGRTGWAVIRLLNEILPFSTATGAALGDPIPVGSGAYQMAITPDGSTAYVPNYASGGISVIDTAARTAGTPIPDEDGPWQTVITPDQPPSAQVSAPISVVAGQPATFDAGNSTDPDGAIARYSWDFGDGESVPHGTSAESHVFTKTGEFPVTVTLTDDEGCSTEFVTAGYTAYCNGSDVATQTLNVKVAAPNNNFSFGKVKLNRKKGTASLQVKLPGAGLVKLAGKNLRPAKKPVKKAGKVALTIRATGKAKRSLKKRGVAKVKAKVTYTPTYGKARTKAKSLKLRTKSLKLRK